MISEALDEYVRSDPKVWKHDRTKTVGASEIGLCARKVHWIKMNRATDWDAGFRDGWGARVRGTTMEEHFWVPALRKKYGLNLRFAGTQQRTLVDGLLSATPDGLITEVPKGALKSLGVPDIKSRCILVECKTIDPRVNLYKEKEENKFQVQVQLGLVRAKTRYKPEYALISYTDASFWNEVMEFPVRWEPKLFDVAHKRAAQILGAKDGRDLPPEGYIAGGKECEYCPFTRRCGIVRRSVPETEAAADPQLVAEIRDTVDALVSLKQKRDHLESEVKAEEQKLKDRLREKGVRRIPGVVSWSAVKGRVAYDMVSIREAALAKGIDVEKFSTVGEPTDRLQIFPRKAGSTRQHSLVR